MKAEALEVIRVDDATGNLVGTKGGIAKKEVTRQNILLRRREEGMFHISEAETLTG